MNLNGTANLIIDGATIFILTGMIIYTSLYRRRGRTDLMYMVRFAILEAVKKYPGDTQVILPRRDESSRKLAAYFFPDLKGEKSVFGSRMEKN